VIILANTFKKKTESTNINKKYSAS